MTSVGVVILNWNGISDTIHCIAGLTSQTYQDFKIILIDNGSSEAGTDKVLKKLKDTHKERIVILKQAKNLGFAGGVNIGITYAVKNSFTYVALLNNDATPDRDWLKILVSTSKKVNSCITTGLLLHSNGNTIDSSGDFYSIWGLPFPRNRNNPTSYAPQSGYIFSATGGATLYKTTLFTDIGLFDESFFAYYEDVDISFRAQLAGWKIYYTDKAIAYHKQGETSKKIPGFTVVQTFKNLPLLFIKNVPVELLFTIGPRFTLAYLLMFGNAIKRGSGKAALTGFLEGTYYFWTKALFDRRSIQRNKKVTSRYIRSLLWNDLPPDQTGLRRLRRILTGK